MKSAVGGRQFLTEKIVLLGAASTGKTSIVNRFAHNHFSQTNEATIGAAFVSKIIKIQDKEIKLEIWDTGGSEKYRSLAPMYYHDTQGAIIVLDLTSQSSFEEAQKWLEELKKNGPSKVVVSCAANKVDIQEHRQVNETELINFVENNQIDIFKETSALNGQNVIELFTELAESILNQSIQQIEPSNVVDITSNPPKQEKGCC